jgi:hypothetical protein
MPAVARATTIELSNPLFRSWNGVIVHQPGAGFSSFLVNQEVTGTGPELQLTHDLGFARADALTQTLSLHPSSAVDARGIDALGYDYAIAEASTWYEADLMLSEGTGVVDLRVDFAHTVIQSTDEPGSAFSTVNTIRVLDESGFPIFGANGFDAVIWQLEHGTRYRLQASLTAYSRATLGHQTSHQRDLELTLTIVPEPASGGLLALGLAWIALCAREQRPGRDRRAATRAIRAPGTRSP